MLFLSWVRFGLKGHRRFFVVRGPVPRKFPTRGKIGQGERQALPLRGIGLNENFLFS